MCLHYTASQKLQNGIYTSLNLITKSRLGICLNTERAIKGVDWIEPQDIIGNIKVGMGFFKTKNKKKKKSYNIFAGSNLIVL